MAQNSSTNTIQLGNAFFVPSFLNTQQTVWWQLVLGVRRERLGDTLSFEYRENGLVILLSLEYGETTLSFKYGENGLATLLSLEYDENSLVTLCSCSTVRTVW